MTLMAGAGPEALHGLNLTKTQETLAKAGLAGPMLYKMVGESLRGSLKEGDLADILMHSLNGMMGLYGVVAGGDEGAHALKTSATTTGIFYISESAGSKVGKEHEEMLKAYAARIPGLDICEDEDEGQGHHHHGGDDEFHYHEVSYEGKSEKEIRDEAGDNNNLIYTRIMLSGKRELIHPTQIKSGDTIEIEGGQTIPVDGTVSLVGGRKQNSAFINNSEFTGQAEEEIFAGEPVLQLAELKGKTPITITATKDWVDSAGVEKYRAMTGEDKSVHESGMKKWIDWYVKALLGLGFVNFFKEGVKKSEKGEYFNFQNFDTKKAIEDTFGFVVSAAPCPLVATMLFHNVYANSLRSRGTDIRKIAHFEKGKDVSAVVLDITKTITEGEPKMQECLGESGQPDYKILEIAAHLESGSTHIAADAIRRDAKEKGIFADSGRITSTPRDVDGGRVCELDGVRATIGSERFYENQGIHLPEHIKKMVEQYKAEGQSVSIVNHGRQWGVVTFRDEIRENAREVVESLKARGVKVYIATGDHGERAKHIAREVGFTEREVETNVVSNMKDGRDAVNDNKHTHGEIKTKVDLIKKLKASGHTVMMVGDGGNDAPAMQVADISAGMSDTAVDTVSKTASVIVQDLGEVPKILWRSKKMDGFAKSFAGLTMLWMGALTTFHFFSEKIHKHFGFNPGNALKGFLHEAATIVTTALSFLGGRWLAGEEEAMPAGNLSHESKIAVMPIHTLMPSG